MHYFLCLRAKKIFEEVLNEDKTDLRFSPKLGILDSGKKDNVTVEFTPKSLGFREIFVEYRARKDLGPQEICFLTFVCVLPTLQVC